jgi:hypothetical protein
VPACANCYPTSGNRSKRKSLPPLGPQAHENYFAGRLLLCVPIPYVWRLSVGALWRFFRSALSAAFFIGFSRLASGAFFQVRSGVCEASFSPGERGGQAEKEGKCGVICGTGQGNQWPVEMKKKGEQENSPS